MFSYLFEAAFSDAFLCVVPNRTMSRLTTFKNSPDDVSSLMTTPDKTGAPPAKRMKTVSNGNLAKSCPQDLMVEVEYFAKMISDTLCLDS